MTDHTRMSDIHHDPVLTKVGIDYRSPALIWPDIAPMVGVEERSAYYPIFGREHMRLPDTSRRESGGGARTVEFGVSKTTFTCEKHALNTFLLRDLMNAANVVTKEQFRQRAVQVVMGMLQMEHENNVRALFMTEASFATGYYLDIDGIADRRWDETSGDPFGDMTTGISAVQTGTNCLEDEIVVIIPKAVWNELRHDSDLLDRIKYTQRGSMTPDILAALLGVRKVLIGGAVYQSARPGLAEVPAALWTDKHVAIIYAPENPGQVASGSVLGALAAANTFKWNNLPDSIEGLELISWIDESKDMTEWIELQWAIDMKPTHVNSSDELTGAYLIENVYD